MTKSDRRVKGLGEVSIQVRYLNAMWMTLAWLGLWWALTLSVGVEV